MKIKPILFNTDMVRAFLEGRKTVTRRVVKLPDAIISETVDRVEMKNGHAHFSWSWSKKFAGFTYMPPYRPGDVLYVRETWNTNPLHEYGNEPNVYVYKADYDGHGGEFGWHPSIHMPREAARIFLRVTDVRVERLQDITEDQAQAEGVKGWMIATDRDWDKNPNHRIAFRRAWNQTIKKGDFALYSWDANPWVWVIAFERISEEKCNVSNLDTSGREEG